MATFRICVMAAAAAMLLAWPAHADTDETSTAACHVEDWRWYHTKALRLMTIEGAASCTSGKVTLRVYDQNGDTREFLGVERAHIEGGIFKTNLYAVDPRPTAPDVVFAVTPDVE